MKKVLTIFCCLILSTLGVFAQESCNQLTHNECDNLGITHDECDILNAECLSQEEPIDEPNWINFLKNLIGLEKPTIIRVNKIENTGTINIGTINKNFLNLKENNEKSIENNENSKITVIKVNKIENTGTINIGTINKNYAKIKRNNIVKKIINN